MKRLFILLFTCISIFNLYSQAAYDVMRYKQQLSNLPSPQAADFMRYNNSASVSKSSGRLDFTIDLMEFSDNNFHIPVSLSYNSAGFMPIKNPSVAGLNWILNVGGVITREVYGIPDDLESDQNLKSVLYNAAVSIEEQLDRSPDKIQTTVGVESRKGFLHIIKDNISNYDYTDEDILNRTKVEGDAFNESAKYGNMYLKGSGLGGVHPLLEATPDIYSFNFLGYSGKFMIGVDSTIRVVSYNTGNFKVDLSDYEMYELKDYEYREEAYEKNSIIKIIADNGYIYCFGGTNECLEYSFQLDKDAEIDIQYGCPINAFYLSKIIAPNGEELEINYVKMDKIIAPPGISSQSQHYIYTESKVLMNQYIRSRGWTSASMDNAYNRILTKTARISSITGKNQTIKFYYSKDTYPMFTKSVNNYRDCGSRLDSIVLTANDHNFRKSVSFKYLQQPRLFLDEVKVQDQKYKFNYYNVTELPAAEDARLDHWGFWNGGRGNPIPSFTNELYKVTYASPCSKDAGDDATVKKGMLKEVIYPTGGKLTIDYEKHTYGKRIENVTGYFPSKPVLTNNSGTAGGTRVKTLTFWDGTKNTIRSFNYNKSNGSSGTLYSWPVYVGFIGKLEVQTDGSFMRYDANYCWWTNYDLNPFSYQYDHVLYSQVKETMSDGGYTISYFTDYETNPDLVSYLYDNPIYESYVPADVFLKLDDYSFQRGKLLREEKYNSGGNLIQKISNTYKNGYNETQGYNGRYGVGLTWLAKRIVDPDQQTPKQVLLYPYKVPLFSYNLIKQTITTNGVEKKTEYVYNWQNLLAGTTEYTSGDGWDGNPITTNYNYPADYETTSPYDEMCAANIINPVVSKRVLSGRNSSWQRETYNYGKILEINNLMKPVYMPKNLQIENSKGLNRIKEQYDYNSYKNLVYKYTGGTGLINKTVYIWSYKGEYPIAEIKNATYDEVKNALSELLIYRVTNVLIPEENDLKAINNLRTTLPNALVTTYTYKPLIGITSATDPRGITTYYEYDSSGRLKTVYIGEKDNNGNEKKRVLNTYDYHYGGQ